MAKLEPIRVNIVEEKGWKPWDPAGDLMEWASNNAWDDWKNMPETECRDLVLDLLRTAFTKRDWKRVSDEDVEAICEELLETTWENLESTFQSIIDAHQWTWEEAYTPSDSDIEEAMEKTTDHIDMELGDHWLPIVGRRGAEKGPKEWSPKRTEGEIVDLLFKRIQYERKPGWYDRYLVFDFGKAEPVDDLIEKGVDPDLLGDEFRQWSQNYLSAFFDALERVMQDADPGLKTDFRKHWKTMLSDKRQMEAVRNEIMKFLPGSRKKRKEAETEEAD